ncbi:ammonium transporter [bacterium]|nr:ammonium transporter [bacterium]
MAGVALGQDAPADAVAAAVDTATEAVAEVAASADNSKFLMDTMWTVLAGTLVFSMQLGFAYVESGFTRAKNSNNIMMKNLMSVCVGTLAYVAVGFAIMFGAGNGLIGTSGWFASGPEGTFASLDWAAIPMEAKLFFQLMFAATAGTIVSGAMAERTKFLSYLVVTAIITAIIYPTIGHWAWGGGWLSGLGEQMGYAKPDGESFYAFTDFAGSTVVHLTGGIMAFLGALIVGARKGKYGPDGKPRAIPGHSIPMATLGVFILWFGWFGFNAGSTMAADGSIGMIALNTNMAAAAGAVSAMFLSLFLFKTYDIGMTLNGALCGLVCVTAGCAAVNPFGATIIGLIGGLLVVGAVVLFDKFVDDPVGAVSVHAVGGASGTIMVGLFATDGGLFYGAGPGLLIIQTIGVLATITFCLVAGSIMFFAVKATLGLRVSEEEEFQGLDLGEHGLSAYPDPGFVGGMAGGGMGLPTANHSSSASHAPMMKTNPEPVA